MRWIRGAAAVGRLPRKKSQARAGRRAWLETLEDRRLLAIDSPWPSLDSSPAFDPPPLARELQAEVVAWSADEVAAMDSAATFPYLEDFESGSLDSLSGWTFSTAGSGTWEVTSADGPHAGSYHLKAVGQGRHEAAVKLDLSSQVGRNDLMLDFWVKQVSHTHVDPLPFALYLSFSDNGLTWSYPLMEISSLSTGSYTHWVTDLDALLGSVQRDQDVYLKLVIPDGREMVFDNVHVSNDDLWGPQVVDQSPTGTVEGPVGSFQVAFDECVDLATFTAADVKVIGPAGAVALAGDPVDSGDQRTFTVNFAAAQSLPGTYRIVVGPGLTDRAGNPMFQGVHYANEQTYTTADYEGQFEIALSTPVQPFPYSEGFESGSIGSLSGWRFTQGWVVTDQGGPHGGAYHLKATSSGNADLKLDLSGQVGRTDLVFDFWVQQLGGTSNYATLRASGDGTTWSDLRWNGTTYQIRPGILDQYTRYAFDLDAALAAAGVALDADVYLRIACYDNFGGQAMTFDDIRIGVATEDLFGPKVAAQSPTGSVPGPATSLQVTFDEEIDAATFTAADVKVFGPAGNPVALAGDPVDSGDHRTFTINLAAPQTMAGTYRIMVGPNVNDLAGNAMNQDGDPSKGEPDDAYQGTFQVFLGASATIPYLEGFESGSFDTLPAWSFATTGNGVWEVTSDSGPRGSYHLRAKLTASSAQNSQEAVLRLDLSGQVGRTDLALDFWARSLTRSDYGLVYLSGNGVDWSRDYPVKPGIAGQYQHYSFDLDAVLAAAGIALDGDVYVKLRHAGSFADELTFDDIRVGAGDVFGPKVSSASPAGGVTGPLSSFQITFDEAIDAATFTADDVKVTGPVGNAIALASDPVDGGDHRTFTVAFASPQTIAGPYRVTIGPNVNDPAGNAMNQDGDSALGELNDAYQGTLRVLSLAAAVPYLEGFESGGIDGLPAWSFSTADGGTWEVTSDGAPRAGTYHLKAGQTVNQSSTNSSEAVLALDLSAYAGRENVWLNVWAQSLVNTYRNSTEMFISGDGTTWRSLGREIAPTVAGQYASYAYNLGTALSEAGIVMDQDVFVKFLHSGFETDCEMTFDDIRVQTTAGPRVTTAAPWTTQKSLAAVALTFDEVIDSASFTADDVVLVDPQANTVRLSSIRVTGDADGSGAVDIFDVARLQTNYGATGGMTPDQGDFNLDGAVDIFDVGILQTQYGVTWTGGSKLFTLSFPEQTTNGLYSLLVGPAVNDLAGDPMNQDRDSTCGEPFYDLYHASFYVYSLPAPVPAPMPPAAMPAASDNDAIASGDAQITTSLSVAHRPRRADVARLDWLPDCGKAARPAKPHRAPRPSSLGLEAWALAVDRVMESDEALSESGRLESRF
ncbi:MAG: Ig-like domain-containing protein [Pirellulales bacterium]